MTLTEQPVKSGSSGKTDRLNLENTLALYKTVGHRDLRYLRWLHKALDSMPLPCVEEDVRPLLGVDKTRVSVFDIMADDLADDVLTRDGVLLDDFVKIPWNNAKGANDYIHAGKLIWEDCIASIQEYPRYKEFERVFYFDLRQIMSANIYSLLVNTLGLDNTYEMNHYSSYGLCVMLFLDMDLMHLRDFDMNELGTMRSVSFLAQKIVRIANMLATYPREVVEHDLSSPIISTALRRHVISREELDDMSVLKKLEQLEPGFKKRAESYMERVAVYESRIHSVNIEGFSRMLKEFLEQWGTSPETRIVLQERGGIEQTE